MRPIPDQRAHPLISIVLVATAALGFRLFLLFVGTWEPDIIDNYDQIAHHLVQGQGFSFDGISPTVCRAPVYPLYLAGIMTVTGHTDTPYTLLRLADILVDSLTAVLVFFLARLWLHKTAPGTHLAAGLVYALNPFIAYYTVKLGAETLQIFCIASFFVLLGIALRDTRQKILIAMALGLAGALVVLSKSVFLPVLIAVPIAVLVQRINRSRRTTARLAIAAVVSILLITPWVYRNHVLTGRVILVQTLAGFNFWYDFTIDENRDLAVASGDPQRVYTGGPVYLAGGQVYQPYGLPAREDAANDASLISEAVQWARNNPPAMLAKMADNVMSFWYVVETPRKMVVAGGFSVVLLVLSITGFVLVRRQHPFEALLFLAVPFLVDILYSPALGVFRYSLVTYPFLCVLAGSPIAFILKYLRTKGALWQGRTGIL